MNDKENKLGRLRKIRKSFHSTSIIVFTCSQCKINDRPYLRETKDERSD